jgi:hypothetical protein
VDYRLGAVDNESLVALEEIGDHLSECLRPFRADRVPGVIDDAISI